MERRTMQNTIPKMSLCGLYAPEVAMIAKTMDAAPLSPANEIRHCWRKEYLRRGVRMAPTARGLAARRRKTNIANAGRIAL